jgi:hypothetical protein
MKEPSAVFIKEPSAELMKEPSAVLMKQSSADYNGHKTHQTLVDCPSAGVV